MGTAHAQANGIQALDCSRQVIALCGDGGFNMLMGEFLTAVHHKLEKGIKMTSPRYSGLAAVLMGAAAINAAQAQGGFAMLLNHDGIYAVDIVTRQGSCDRRTS